ncbi:protein FAM83B-like [Brachionichthys hirsutus]|uniref:protein FAM83B-like n=1 Tax=Brachionichthys hirsutus TaxID=412623 RepID=UPI003604D402
MESPRFSLLSSLTGELTSEDFIPPHYKESYRLAVDFLVKSGKVCYQEFLKGERIGSFLSEEEILFISENVEPLPPQDDEEEIARPIDNQSSSGTYWPTCSDVDAPDLDLGWPVVMQDTLQTNIDLLFHPPRENSPTIKEVVRKNIQEARQVVAIVMDMFTDVDIFKEVVDASIRGVPVYILLDCYHLKGFLTMAENQDVKLQQMRNMRVRTVKGQTYLCRSGAKFHGAMQQKFLLIDCHTAISGSYSFSWSFEKIHLSMVQVITGQLVKSYDEEFRTLFARSSVPAQLPPLEGLFERNGPRGPQMVPKTYSALKIDRRDQLRHTLDTVYRKTCERKGMRDLDDRHLEEDAKPLGPLIGNGLIRQDHILQYQSTEAMDFLKRHSYAGERRDGYSSQDYRPRASNWNIARETGHVSNNYSMDNYLQVPSKNRGQNIHQTYDGNHKQVLSLQQNMPAMENTSRSFMRRLRLESYFQHADIPFGDSCDHLDQFDPLDKVSSFMQGRMRSSLVLRSTIPEQMEVKTRINNASFGVTPAAAPNAPLHYSSMQWNPAAANDNRMNYEDFMSKRKNLQILDDSQNNKSYGSGRNSYQPGYASLGRAKGGHMTNRPDIWAESWMKRQSMADENPNHDSPHELSGHVYKALARTPINRSAAGIGAQNGGYGSSLNEDQRSVSHYDVKGITETQGRPAPNWQVPPTRTVSAAAIHVNNKDLMGKSSNVGSHHFLKKSSKKLKSLLNIPEKKEDSIGTLESLGSVGNETADEEAISYGQERLHQRTNHPIRSTSDRQRSRLDDDHLNYSNPRFRVEEHQNPPQTALPTVTAQKRLPALDQSSRPGLDIGSWRKDQRTENRLYSRYEPFCSMEMKHSTERRERLPRGEVGVEHNLTRAARGQHENKLEKFFHRVGNFIHKGK